MPHKRFLSRWMVFVFIATITPFIQAQKNVWTPINESNLEDFVANAQNLPRKFSIWQFSTSLFHNSYTKKSRENTWLAEFPLPDGQLQEFIMKETPVFSEELSKKYHGFLSFTGRSVDGSLTVKMSMSPFGVDAMILGSSQGPIMIDPVVNGARDVYMSYYRKETVSSRRQFFCGVKAGNEIPDLNPAIRDQHNNPKRSVTVGDCTLRTYRLALACTGEYARFHGGTIPKVLAAYNTSITRVNSIYERDVAITLKLIADTDKLIFLDPATDPYTNNDGGVMLDQNQQTIDQRIGYANYDIGHVFSTGGGGIAQLRAPCGGGKARGVTGLSSPAGDPFDIDYVCHEMGHQFGANHTQNNDCQRNQATAVEPGSASTIMGYAGICDPNIQNNSDAHFHAISIEEIHNFTIAGGGNQCAEKTNIDNSAPEILETSKKYTIPVSTAFALTARASDVDGDKLTYCWEQTDSDAATMPPLATSKVGPSFRSLLPSPSPTRYFPDLLKRYGQWEVIPSTSRTMNFTCTVRDNNLEGGCVSSLEQVVEFTSVSGPFLVTYPNVSTVNWPAGSKQTVRWNVSKTDLAPVNCKIVDIFLSIDGGETYPHQLAQGVPNSGSYEVVTPGLPTTKARIMVKAADNIFFDVSNASFKITSSFQLYTDTTLIRVCEGDTLRIPIVAEGNAVLSQPLYLSASGLPQGVNTDIVQPENLTLPFNGFVTLSGLQNLPFNNTFFTITGTSGDEQISLTVTLFREKTSPTDVELTLPLPGKADLNPAKVVFAWKNVPGVYEYQMEVSNNAAFLPAIFSSVTFDTSLIASLEPGRVFFWKVKALSVCTENEFSPAQAFRTKGASAGKAVVWVNNPLLVEKGKSAMYSSVQLDIATANPGFVLCTVRDLPRHGSITLQGTILTKGSYFSFTDVLESRLVYTHNNHEQPLDSLVIDILDDQGRSLEGLVCPIRIRQSALGVTAFIQNRIRCAGDENAEIEAVAYGGIAPYYYSIDGVDFLEETKFQGLADGQYQITVADATGEIVLSNVLLVTEPEKIEISPEVSFYDILVNASGGTGRLSYSINGGLFVEENLFKDPGNGVFFVYVKDEAQCMVVDSIQISVPVLSGTAQLTSDISCAGQKAGISCQASGGIPPYRYSVDGTTYQANANFTVDAGNYTPFVKDAGGKVVATSAISTNMPPPIQVLLLQNRLQVVVLASGGTGKLLYSSDNINFTERDTFTFAQNGLYKIYVRDEKGCIRSSEISLNVLTEVLASVTHNTCYGGKAGKVSLQPTNGKGPFKYRFGSNAQGSERQFSNLAAGDYSYTVWDAAYDSVQGNVVILQPDSLMLDALVIGDSLQLAASGGKAPYQFSIDGGVVFLDINLFDNLTSGDYFPAVRDSFGCVTINKPISIISSVVESASIKRITLFPNPSREVLFLYNSTLAVMGQPKCYSVHGEWMDNVRFTSTAQGWQVDISSLPAGVYFLKMNSEGTTFTTTFVKIE